METRTRSLYLLVVVLSIIVTCSALTCESRGGKCYPANTNCGSNATSTPHDYECDPHTPTCCIPHPPRCEDLKGDCILSFQCKTSFINGFCPGDFLCCNRHRVGKEAVVNSEETCESMKGVCLPRYFGCSGTRVQASCQADFDCCLADEDNLSQGDSDPSCTSLKGVCQSPWILCNGTWVWNAGCLATVCCVSK